MYRGVKTAENALRDAKHILLRGVPTATTPGDLKRALLQADVKGVADVELYYKHFRPTGKAILTLALPDYVRDAIHRLKNVTILGGMVGAEPVQIPQKMGIDVATSWQLEAAGNGPSAGVSPGRTVSLFGTPGRLSIHAIQHMVKDYKLAKPKGHPPIQVVPLPPRKFSLFSRFCVHLASESEAHRLVRELHMTPYKGIEGGPIMKAEIIY